MPQKKLKILIIRFSSIGDIVLTTPVIRGLKLQLGAEVHFLCKQVFADLIEPNPYVDRLFMIQKDIDEVLPDLKLEAYDYLIDLHKNLRSLRLRLALRQPVLTFDKVNWQKWIMVRFKINRLPTVHIVDRYLQALAPLGVINDGKGLDYFIAPKDELSFSQLQQRFPNPSFDWNHYLAFAIGAAHATKQLPEAQIIAICQQVDSPIVLIGGPKEQKMGERIEQAVGPHVVNTCGQLTLGQSATLLKKARKVITPDTGMMHIAAAFGKEILTIWGNTIPDFGMYPYLTQEAPAFHSFEVPELSCRPCSKIGFEQCPKGHFRCMKDQDIGGIVGRVVDGKR